MSYQLDFSTTGLMIRTGDGPYDLHLASVSTFAGSTITVSGRVVEDGVTLTEVGSSVQHNFQIADCSSPVYATPQDLMDDIETAIAAMYAGGGGGTGDVVGPASSTADNIPQWNGTTGKLLKNGFATTQQSTGSTDGGKIVRLSVAGALYGVSEAGANGVNGVSDSGDGVRGDSTTGDGGHFTSGTGKGVNAINSSDTEPAVLAANGGDGLALEALNNSGTPGVDLARIWDGADGVTVENDGALVWDSATGAANTRAALGLPNVYAAIVSQVGGVAPTVAGVTNQLGGTPVLAYVAGGEYALTITGAFTENKTYISLVNDSGALGIAGAFRTNVNTITILTVDPTFSSNDGILNSASLIVSVYP